MNRPRSLWSALLAAFLSSVLMGVVAIQLSAHAQRQMESRLDVQQQRLAQQQDQLAEQSRVTGLALCFLAAGVDPADGPKAAELAQRIRDTFHC